MKKFLLSLVFLFLFTSCNDPSKDVELLPVEQAEVKEVDVTGMVGELSRVYDGMLSVGNPGKWDLMSPDGKLLRGDYPFKELIYLGLGRFFVKENEESGYIIDSKGKVIADNFMGRPIIRPAFGFSDGFLGVEVKREQGDTVLKFGGLESKATGESPIMYNFNGGSEPKFVYGTLDADGNIYKDGSPFIFGYIETKEGYRVEYGYDKCDVVYYRKTSEDKRETLFGLYDAKENIPLTEPLYYYPFTNSSSRDESGSFAAITKDDKFLWLDNQGGTILDIGEIFPKLKGYLERDMRRAFMEGKAKGTIISFASKDTLVLKSSKNSKAIVVGKDGKVLGGLDADEFLDSWDFDKCGRYSAYKNHEGKWGVLRDDLKVVVEPSYDEITSVDKNYFVGVRGEKTFLCTIVE